MYTFTAVLIYSEDPSRDLQKMIADLFYILVFQMVKHYFSYKCSRRGQLREIGIEIVRYSFFLTKRTVQGYKISCMAHRV